MTRARNDAPSPYQTEALGYSRRRQRRKRTLIGQGVQCAKHASTRIGHALLLALTLIAYPPAGTAAGQNLQILHASDMQGDVSAVTTAPGFAATVQALREDAAQRGWPSILLSAGGLFIPGPFFDAANTPSVTPQLRALSGYAGAQPGRGRADIALLNALGLDASALGNHEFDAGAAVFANAIASRTLDRDRDGLADRIDWLGAHFPLLSANLDFRADPDLAPIATYEMLPSTAFRASADDPAAAAKLPRLAPATVVMAASQRIGIVGASSLNLDQLTRLGGARVVRGQDADPIRALAQVLQPTIDALRNAGIDKIILLSHLRDIALEQTLATLLDGVDIIIAGGSESILKDDNDRLRAGDQAVGAYPLRALSASSEPVLIIGTGGHYRYLGRLVVEFDDKGLLRLDSLDDQINGVYATDEQGVEALWGDSAKAYASDTLASRVKHLTDAIGSVLVAKSRQGYGLTSEFLDGRRTEVRSKQTNLGDLVADAYLESARDIEPNVQAAILNGGAIRASIGKAPNNDNASTPAASKPTEVPSPQEISRLDIENVLSFNNPLTLLSLKPEQLVQTLEHALSMSAEQAAPGRYPQVAGLALSYDLSRPPGSRIRNLVIKDSLQRSIDIVLLDGMIQGDSERRIRVVTNRFLADGGDGYPFADFLREAPEQLARKELTQGNDKGSTGGESGGSGFSPTGTEQDALAVYLRKHAARTPLARAELLRGQDERLQQLSERSGTVLAPLSPALRLRQSLSDSGPSEGEFVDLALTLRSRLALDRASDNESDAELGRPPAQLAFDTGSQRLFVTRPDHASVAIIALADTDRPKLVGEIALGPLYADRRTRIEPTSVAIHNGLLAVSLQRHRVLDGSSRRGILALFDIAGHYLGETEVGFGPAMTSFTPDGARILVANHGKPSPDYSQDPEGSLSVVDVSSYIGCVQSCEDQPVTPIHITPAQLLDVDFRAFNPLKLRLRNQGIRIYGPRASVAQDLEPSAIAVTNDAGSAWVALPVNNALAQVNLDTFQIQELVPLGQKWWPPYGGLDASDVDMRINIQPWPVHALYQPNRIEVARIGPDTYILSANSGQSRNYKTYSEGARVDELKLDPTRFADAKTLAHPQALGRLLVSTVDADTDGDGDVDRLFSFGARSFSIWKTAAPSAVRQNPAAPATGGLQLVYDSGNELERLLASVDPAAFNAANDDSPGFDQRSGDTGVQPDGITVGQAFGRQFAFILLPGPGVIAVYDITVPSRAFYVTHLDSRASAGDRRPRDQLFISGDRAASRPPMLVVAYEQSGSVAIFELSQKSPDPVPRSNR